MGTLNDNVKRFLFVSMRIDECAPGGCLATTRGRSGGGVTNMLWMSNHSGQCECVFYVGETVLLQGRAETCSVWPQRVTVWTQTTSEPSCGIVTPPKLCDLDTNRKLDLMTNYSVESKLFLIFWAERRFFCFRAVKVSVRPAAPPPRPGD